MRDLRAAALRGTAWSAVQQIGDRGVRIVVYLVLARLLSPHAFGLVALAAAYVDFLQIFRNQGVTVALVQRERLLPEHLDSAFWGGMVLGLVMGGVGFASAGAFSGMAGHPELKPVVRWLSLGFLLAALSAVQDAMLRRELRFDTLAVRSLVGQTLAGGVAIVAALRGLGVWSLVLMPLVFQAVSVLLLWRASPWQPAWRFSWVHFRELLAFGVGMTGLYVLRFGRERADNFVIGLGLGATALGYYSVANQVVGGIWGLVVGSASPVLWSTLTRLQEERTRLARAIHEATEILAVATWPMFLGLAAVASLAVPVVLGGRWAASAPILAALAVGVTARSFLAGPFNAILALGQTRRAIAIELVVALVTVGAMAAALPWGIVALAWAHAAALLLMVPVQLRICLPPLEISAARYLEAFRVPALGSLVMLGALLAAKAAVAERVAALPALVALVVLGAAVYVAIVNLAAPAVIRRTLGNLRSAVRLSDRSRT